MLVGIKRLSCCSEITLMGRGISVQVAPAQAVGTNRSGQTVSQRLRNCKSTPLLALCITWQQLRTGFFNFYFLLFHLDLMRGAFAEVSADTCLLVQPLVEELQPARGSGQASIGGEQRWALQGWNPGVYFSQLNCWPTINIFLWQPHSLHCNCAFSETAATCTTPESDLKVLCNLFFLCKYISFIYLFM